MKYKILQFLLGLLSIKVVANGNDAQIDLREFKKKHPKLAESVLKRLEADLQNDPKVYLTINGDSVKNTKRND